MDIFQNVDTVQWYENFYKDKADELDFMLHCEFGLLLLNKIQDMIRNVNTSLMILKTIQHIKS